MVGWL